MKPFELRELRPTDQVSFNKAVRAFATTDPEWCFAFDFDPHSGFQEYCQRLRRQQKGVDLPDGWVPETFLVTVVGDRIVGRVTIRHRLNADLRKRGGHIGYGVVPGERGKGYATAMLKEALRVARDIGLERVLVTCDDDNAPSIRTIEKNGGRLQDTLPQAGTVVPIRRYWIDLRSEEW